MKIAIDLTSLSYHLTGIERYALCVTQEMLEIDQSNQYVLIFRNEMEGHRKPRRRGSPQANPSVYVF